MSYTLKEIEVAISAIRKEADWYDTKRWQAHGQALVTAANMLEQMKENDARYRALQRLACSDEQTQERMALVMKEALPVAPAVMTPEVFNVAIDAMRKEILCDTQL